MAATYSTEVYLVFSLVGRYPKLSVRLAIKKPSLKPGEIPMRLNLSVPGRLFDTPAFVATLAIPDTVPESVKIDMPDRIAQLVKEQMGISLTIIQPDKENGN